VFEFASKINISDLELILNIPREGVMSMVVSLQNRLSFLRISGNYVEYIMRASLNDASSS
jgi:hypothetical protein